MKQRIGSWWMSGITKLQWEKASLRVADPARAQQTNDIMPPDQVVVGIENLSAREKDTLDHLEAKRAVFRAALKADRNKRGAARRAKRNAIFREDADREARLCAESNARRCEKESQ